VTSGSDEQRHFTYLRVVLGFGVFVLWVIPLRSSFWLDETVTAWVVQDGFRETLHRAFNFQPMFPTYYVVAWLAKTLGGTHEWVLRFPSFLALGIAAVVVARIGRRLFDRETGILAAIVFATSFQGAHIATDARPYALGVLALVVATLLLIRWLDTGDAWAAAGCVAAAAFVVYVHYLLGAALIAHVVYALRRRRDVGSRALIAASLAFVVLLLPLVPWFLHTYDRRSILSLGLGSVSEVAATIAPPALVAALLIGALAVGRRLQIETPRFRAGSDEVVLLGLWTIGPPILLLSASHVTGVGVFTPRYVVSSIPAVSLLAGAAIRMIGPMNARRLVVAVVVAGAVVSTGPLQHTDDSGFFQDWRGALAATRASVTEPSTPVLMQSELIEGSQVALLDDPAWVPYLMAPASAYGIEGRLVPAPYGFSQSERAYLEKVTEQVLLPADRFFLVATIDLTLEAWLEGRVERLGYVPLLVGRFGIVRVVEFTRTSSG
jgi:hypothetical protein